MEKYLIDYHKQCEKENIRDILKYQDEPMTKEEWLFMGNLLVKGKLKINLKKYGESSWEYQVYKEMIDTKYVEQIAEEYFGNSE